MWAHDVTAAGYPMRAVAANGPTSRWEQIARVIAASAWPARRRAKDALRRADAVLAATNASAPDRLLRDIHMLAAVQAAKATLALTPRRVQVAAALAAADGCIVEVPTGGGKTLALALAAATLAAQGVDVHVLTANDYLAERDCDAMRPLYARLGLSVSAVTAASPPSIRRALHGSAVTYCSAREIVFDFLRDRGRIGDAPTDLGLQRLGDAVRTLALRGLSMALIDEADAILLDESTQPFVLATPSEGRQSADIDSALAIVRRLRPQVHRRRVDGRTELTPAGARLVHDALPRTGPWRQPLFAAEAIGLALTARFDLQRDRDYLVDATGGVRIVNALSGRCADGQRWSAGLHETVERKEGLLPGGGSSDRSAITFQAFFQRFLRIGGMSATVVEARREIAAVYGVPTVSMAQADRSTRDEAPAVVWRTDRERTRALVDTLREATAAGRAALVATASVWASEALARTLSEAGIEASVLNAKTHEHEAELVRHAGAASAVTIATAMVGRGTDIAPSADVDARGGLLVVIAFLPASRRAERQLAGRTGRAGRPGRVLRYFSLDDEIALRHLPRVARQALTHGTLAPFAWLALRWARRQAEHEVESMRCRLPARQHADEKRLAFAGLRDEREKFRLDLRTRFFALNIGTNQPMNRELLFFRIRAMTVPPPLASLASRAMNHGGSPRHFRRALRISMLTASIFVTPMADAGPLRCLMEPELTADIGTPVIGVIEAVLVQRGDRVQRGQLIARLAASVEQRSVELATARLSATSDKVAAEVSAQFALRKVERTLSLVDEGFLSPQASDQAITEADLAVKKVGQTQDQRVVYDHELRLARAQYEQRMIRSPIDGVVVDIFLNAGERIEEKPLARVALIRRLRVESVLASEHYGRVAVGMHAKVTPDLPGAAPRDAVVTLVDPVIDPASNTFRIRLSLPNDVAPTLPSGLRCSMAVADIEAPTAAAPGRSGASDAAFKPTADARRAGFTSALAISLK